MNKTTLLSRDKQRALLDVLDTVTDTAGDMAELGVYRGGAARLMALHSPGKTLRLFDTFEGLPPHDEADAFHRPGEFQCSLSDVKAFLSDCPNVVYHVGRFPATAAGDVFSIVHLDADLYESTRAGLEYFWPRLAVGGALVLDDWHWRFCEGVTRAVNDYFTGTGYRFEERAANQLIVWKP